MDAKSLRQRAFSGSAYVMAGSAATHILRFVGNVVLTRLLVPEYFGLMALINVFVAGVQMIGDLGLKPSVIQNKSGYDENFLNTAWTIQVGRGASLWLFLSLLSYPIALFYKTPELAYLIPLVSFSLVLSGFNSTNLITLNKQLEMKRLVLCDLLSQTGGLFLMVGWAYFYPSIWALVAGTLITSGIKLGLGHLICPGIRNHFHWDSKAGLEIIHFGKWILLSSVVTLLLRESDRVIMGKFFSWQQLGVYSIALMLSRFPLMINSQLGHAILFPALSEKHNTSFSVVPPLRKYKLVTAQLFLLLLAIGTVYGPAIVGFIYDPRYHEAGWMFSLLCLGQAPMILNQSNTLTLFARGKPKYSVLSQACGASWLIIGILLGGRASSIHAVTVAVATASIPAILVIWVVARRYQLKMMSMDLGLLAMFFTSVLAMLALAHQITVFWQQVLVNLLVLLAISTAFSFAMTKHWKIRLRDLLP